MKYRPEIDGLRALAVLPVVLFHAGFDFFSGGYVGVDVFFVISGYLICSILLADLDRGRFSILTFYERRARRILPALFAVTITCIPFAWMFLGSRDFIDFSQSLVAVSLFSSNVLFWLESDYFDQAAELKPLLHTWSLAVEEQYYLVFPLLLLVFRKLTSSSALYIFFILMLASLLLSQWATSAFPTAGFYLLPTRAWELLLGVIAAYLLRKQLIAAHGTYRELLSFVGLGLIAGAIVIFDHSTPFPGVYALVPTIGTMLIILFSDGANMVGRFLSHRFLVGVGLVSYSLYLWHQPILAFYKRVDSPSTWALVVLIGLTILLSYFSWRFIELPFRNDKISRKSVFVASGSVTVVVLGLGMTGYLFGGFPAESVRVSAPVVSSSHLNPGTTMVIGDSHAWHIYDGINVIVDAPVIQRSSGGCIPFYNVDRFDRRIAKGTCVQHTNTAIEEFLRKPDVRNLVLASMGPVYMYGTPFRGKDPERVRGQVVQKIDQLEVSDPVRVYEIGLRETLELVSADAEKNVVVTIDVPELGIENGCFTDSKRLRIGSFVIKDFIEGVSSIDCKIPRKEVDDRTADYKRMVKRIVSEFPSVKIYDPTDLFCDKDWCYGYLPAWGFLYRDADHLSRNGSLLVAENLLPLLK